MSEHLQNMLENAEKNKETQRSVQFKLENEDCCISTVDIPMDGDCLFSAIAHQLYKTDLKSDEHLQKKKTLRTEVVTFIKNNYSKFEFDLKGRVYERFGKVKKADLGTKIGFFLNDKQHGLNADTVWGGNETLLAVRMMFSVNILIINEAGDFSFAGGFNPSFKNVIALAFKLKNSLNRVVSNDQRNHYESIIHIDAVDLYGLTRAIANK